VCCLLGFSWRIKENSEDQIFFFSHTKSKVLVGGRAVSQPDRAGLEFLAGDKWVVSSGKPVVITSAFSFPKQEAPVNTQS
jgi:hypothetical protein